MKIVKFSLLCLVLFLYIQPAFAGFDGGFYGSPVEFTPGVGSGSGTGSGSDAGSGTNYPPIGDNPPTTPSFPDAPSAVDNFVGNVPDWTPVDVNTNTYKDLLGNTHQLDFNNNLLVDTIYTPVDINNPAGINNVTQRVYQSDPLDSLAGIPNEPRVGNWGVVGVRDYSQCNVDVNDDGIPTGFEDLDVSDNHTDLMLIDADGDGVDDENPLAVALGEEQIAMYAEGPATSVIPGAGSIDAETAAKDFCANAGYNFDGFSAHMVDGTVVGYYNYNSASDVVTYLQYDAGTLTVGQFNLDTAHEAKKVESADIKSFQYLPIDSGITPDGVEHHGNWYMTGKVEDSQSRMPGVTINGAGEYEFGDTELACLKSWTDMNTPSQYQYVQVKTSLTGNDTVWAYSTDSQRWFSIEDEGNLKAGYLVKNGDKFYHYGGNTEDGKTRVIIKENNTYIVADVSSVPKWVEPSLPSNAVILSGSLFSSGGIFEGVDPNQFLDSNIAKIETGKLHIVGLTATINGSTTTIDEGLLNLDADGEPTDYILRRVNTYTFFEKGKNNDTPVIFTMPDAASITANLPGGLSLNDIIDLKNMSWDFDHNKLIVKYNKDGKNFDFFINQDNSFYGYLNHLDGVTGLAIYKVGDNTPVLNGTIEENTGLNSLSGLTIGALGVEESNGKTVISKGDEKFNVVGTLTVEPNTDTAIETATEQMKTILNKIGVTVPNGVKAEDINGRYVISVGDTTYSYDMSSQKFVKVSSEGIDVYSGVSANSSTTHDAAGNVTTTWTATIPDNPEYHYSSAVVTAITGEVADIKQIAAHLEVLNSGELLKEGNINVTESGNTAIKDYYFGIKDGSVEGSLTISKNSSGSVESILIDGQTLDASKLQSMGLNLSEFNGQPVCNGNNDWVLQFGDDALRVYKDGINWQGVAAITDGSTEELKFWGNLSDASSQPVVVKGAAATTIWDSGDAKDIVKQLSYKSQSNAVLKQKQDSSDKNKFTVYRLEQGTLPAGTNTPEPNVYRGATEICTVSVPEGQKVLIEFANGDKEKIEVTYNDLKNLLGLSVDLTPQTVSQAVGVIANRIYDIKNNGGVSGAKQLIFRNAANTGYTIVDLKAPASSGNPYGIDTDKKMDLLDQQWDAIVSNLSSEVELGNGQKMAIVDLEGKGIMSDKVIFDTATGKVKITATTKMSDGTEREDYQCRVFDTSDGSEKTVGLTEDERLTAMGKAYKEAVKVLDVFGYTVNWDVFKKGTVPQSIQGQSEPTSAKFFQADSKVGTEKITVVLDDSNKIATMLFGTTSQQGQTMNIGINFDWQDDGTAKLSGTYMDKMGFLEAKKDKSYIDPANGKLHIEGSNGSLDMTVEENDTTQTVSKEYSFSQACPMPTNGLSFKSTETYKKDGDNWKLSGLVDTFSDGTNEIGITYTIADDGTCKERVVKEGEASAIETITGDGDWLDYRNKVMTGEDPGQLEIEIAGSRINPETGKAEDISGGYIRTRAEVKDKDGNPVKDANGNIYYQMVDSQKEKSDDYYQKAIELGLTALGLKPEGNDVASLLAALKEGGASKALQVMQDLLNEAYGSKGAEYYQKIEQNLQYVFGLIEKGKQIAYDPATSKVRAISDPLKILEDAANKAKQQASSTGSGGGSPAGSGGQQKPGAGGNPKNPAAQLGGKFKNDMLGKDGYFGPKSNFESRVNNAPDAAMEKLAQNAGMSVSELKEKMLSLSANDARKMYLSKIGLQEKQIQHLMSIMGDKDAAIAYLMKVLGLTEEEAAALYELLSGMTQEDAMKMYLEKLGYTDEEVQGFMEVFNKMNEDMEQYLRETLGITDESLITELLGMSKADAEAKLKEEGYTDEEIAGYFEKQDAARQYLKDTFGIEDDAEIDNILSMDPAAVEEHLKQNSIDVTDIEGIDTIDDFAALPDSEKLEKLITYLVDKKGMDYAAATDKAAGIISDLNSLESGDAVSTYLNEHWQELQKEDWLDTFMDSISDLNTYQQKQKLMEIGLTEEEATNFFKLSADNARLDFLMNECGLDQWTAQLWVGKELQEDGSLKTISYSNYLKDIFDAVEKAAEDLGYGKQAAQKVAEGVQTGAEAQSQYQTQLAAGAGDPRLIDIQPGTATATDTGSSESSGFSDSEMEAISNKLLTALLTGEMLPENAYDVAKSIISEVAGAAPANNGDTPVPEPSPSDGTTIVNNPETATVGTAGVSSVNKRIDTFANQYKQILLEVYGEEEGLRRFQEWYQEYIMNQ